MAKEYPLNVKTPRSVTYVTRNIPEVTVEQRERALKATHYNEFAFPAGMLTLPVGGFLVLGVLIAVMQWALSKSKK